MATTVENKPGLDPVLPNVPVILGGVERHLAFDYNAIVLAEKETGVNLLKAIVSDIDATRLRGLLWAALLKENPRLTIDEVGGWIHARNAAGLHQALLQAWFGSIPEPDAENASKGEDPAQATPIA